uniref:Uncharacterized protein n=1 Tax=Anguilla anguilla TaxID=7936 RepID=A0A0E9SKM9_ANGAN
MMMSCIIAAGREVCSGCGHDRLVQKHFQLENRTIRQSSPGPTYKMKDDFR